jgi:uncharacterized repeat protein (TIGR03847 family)
MTVFFQFEHADRFTAGALGRPGQRTFFLQVRSDDEIVTIKCEKQQVAAMAEYLQGLLADVPTPQDLPAPELMALVDPIEPSFVLGPIGLAFDRDTGQFVVQLEELVPELDRDDADDDEVVEEPERSTVRTLLSPGQVLSFCQHVEELVAAGRPPCVYCGGPIDPQGHACPRMN